MTTMHFTIAGRVAVLRHTHQGPSDAEWTSWVEALVTHQREHGERMRTVIWTDGGSPSPSQRAQLKHFDSIPAAVVSGRMAVRFIVSAIALFNHDIRAFAPNEIDAAFSHLGLSPTERAEVRRALDGLGEKLTRAV